MTVATSAVLRLSGLAERLNALSLRERGLIFGAGMTLVYIAWQTLCMTPLDHRARTAEQQLVEAHRHLAMIEQLGAAAATDPATAAAARNRALHGELARLDHELGSAAQGYVAPQRATALLRDILATQHGLHLVRLANLPVESLSEERPHGVQDPAGAAPESQGPFLHPIEIVVDGDYASVLDYLRAIEGLPFKIHWQTLTLSTAPGPSCRVRIIIGALSLSREWISV